MGCAVKSTWALINGEEVFLSKDPKTDSGLKKSATGRLAVIPNAKGYNLVDNLPYSDWVAIGEDKLRPVDFVTTDKPYWESLSDYARYR